MSVNSIIMAAAGASAGGQSSWNANANLNGAESYGIIANYRGEIYATNYYGFGSVASIMKLNSSGALQWQKYVNSYAPEAVTADGAGNAYILGSTQHPYIAKFNSAGTLVFQKDLVSAYTNGDFNGAFYDVSSDRIYAVGFAPTATMSQNGLIVCMDTSANVIWQKLLFPPGSETPPFPGLVLEEVNVDPSGNVVVIGRGTNPDGGVAPIVAKYSSSGTLLWKKYISAPNASYTANGNGVQIDSSSNIYLTGNLSRGPGDAVITPFVCKLNSSGAMQWSRWVYTDDGGGYQTGDVNIALDTIRNIIYFPFQSTGTNFTTIHQIDTSGTSVGAQGLAANVGAAPAFELAFISIVNYSGQSVLYGAGRATIATSQSSIINLKGLNATFATGGGVTNGPVRGAVYTAALVSTDATTYTNTDFTGVMTTATNTITDSTLGWTVYG